MMKAGISSALFAVSTIVACGGESAPPQTPPAPSASASPEPVSAAPDASAPAPLSSTSVAAADADAGAPASKPAGGTTTSSSSGDECTPVGVDFEKRARPKLKECYQAGKKKDPNLAGTVKVKMTIDVKGKIKTVKVIEKTLPDPVADCMLKAVKATPFPEVEKCWDASITIPITFPTPK